MKATVTASLAGGPDAFIFDGVIYLRMEEGDTVREIHMGAELATVDPYECLVESDD